MQTAALLSPVLQPFPLLSVLREGTIDLHNRIESRMNLAAQFASMDAYRAFLERYYGLYAPIEGQFAFPDFAAAAGVLGVDFAARRKSSLIESDLRFLGLTSQDLDRLPRCCATDCISPSPAPAELAGCAYVLEGATLGGQLIGRCLDQALGLSPGKAGALFFHGYGARNGAMWQRFKRDVEAFAAREEQALPGSRAHIEDLAVGAARRTFATMDAWLCQ